jgi:tetratricopeptide (TPR) repeat protein
MLRPKDAEPHWWLGEIRREQGRTEEAEEHYRRVTEREPERGEAWLRLGARALKLNQYEPALALLDRAEKRLPTGEVAQLRARALWKLGRLEEAQVAARQAVAREPAPASLLVLGQVLAASPRTADWREAAASLQRAVDQEPRNDEARRELGLVYRQLGEHRKAVRELRAHLRLNPGAARSYLPLAQSYQALGKPELSAQVLRIYRRLEPIEIKTAQAEYRVLASREAPEARLALARTYAECGFEDRARQELQALLRAHPDDAEAAKLLARLADRRSLVIPPLPPDPEADS